MSSKNEYHHGDLKAVLLALALADLETKGLEALSLRDLASQAGVSKTAPYRHFEDKNALLGALAAVGLKTLADRMHEALEAQTSGKTVLRTLGEAYLRTALEKPQLFRLMFSSFGLSLEAEDCVREGERAYALLTAGTQRAMEAGYGRGLPLEAAVVQAWSHIHGLANLILEGLVSPQVLTGPEAQNYFILY